MKKLFLLAMLAVFQLSALKAQGNSYKPVENYTFVEKNGKRYQEIRLVDKVDVFNEKKRDKYIEENGLGYSIEQYCRILEKTAEYMVKYDSEGDVNAASTFCNYLYAGLDYGNGPIWGLGDLKRKEFKKNLKNLIKYKTPTDEEMSYYNRIAETVEHHIDSVVATWVYTKTVVREIYMPVDINDTIVSYKYRYIDGREIDYIGPDSRSCYNYESFYTQWVRDNPYSMAWFELKKLGIDSRGNLSEENRELRSVRDMAYLYLRTYPINCRQGQGCAEYQFNFKYKNGDYVNGIRLCDQYCGGIRSNFHYEEAFLTKDKGVYKGGTNGFEIVLDNGDIFRGDGDSRDAFFYKDYFPRYGMLYSASGEFKDKLWDGKWESEVKAEEEARKKAKEAAAAEAREKELGELRKKYGERWVKIYEEGDYQKAIGMPEELAKKMFEDNYCKLINYSRWSDGSVYYDVFQCLPGSSSLGWLKGHVWFYNGKLSSWRFEN